MPSSETVTVVITDLVGSTDLASRLGPVAADELRQEHFGVLREAAADSGGKEVKSTGDGLMLVFRGAADAVACAISIQQRMERRNRAAEVPLPIRVGVALGDATCDEGDYFGMPVVEAARLCDAADGGRILASELVQRIGGRDGHVFVDAGELELRGLPEPLTAYEVSWESAQRGAAAVPLPAQLDALGPDGYVGREREGARLRERWDAALAGPRQGLLVSGEPGIGKTRFLTQAALELHAEGAVVLVGHCPEELQAPYGAWIQALSHYVEHTPQDLLGEHVERHGGELSRLVPALIRRVPDAPPPKQTDPETERYLLFSAVGGLLEGAGGDSPLVLLLDDLHWADRPTLALLKHVLGEARPSRLLLLGTYRDSDLSGAHPLTGVLADLRREEGVERLALRGLGQEDVVSLMEAAARHEMDETGVALAREIAAETDGNPFFVVEMLRHLLESGALVRVPDGRWELRQRLEALGLPQSVREVVGRRVERLGEECRTVLSSAAVIGRTFDLELLLRIARVDEDRLIDLLDAAVEASLLTELTDRAGSFTFAHNLINHILYDDLGATRRSRLHRRAAEALEGLCGGEPGARISELARHWTAATAPIDANKAVSYSARAGERALSELAPDEAVRWFAQAVELLDKAPDPDPAWRCDLAIALGEAQRQAGKLEFRETLLGAAGLAEELRDPELTARAALANNRGFASAFGAVDEERVAVLERAIELDDGTDASRRARLLALHAMELQFDPRHEHRRALAEEALALARRASDVHVLPYVLRDYFHAVWSADTLPARRRVAEEMMELADRVDDPLARIWALDRTVHAAAESGKLTVAAEASAQLVRRTGELGQPDLRWHAAYFASGLAQMQGALDDAERLAEAAARLGQGDDPDTMVIYWGQICAVRSDQGRTEETLELLELAAVANPGIPAFQAGLAAALCDSGRAADAAPMLERAGADGFANVPKDQVYSTALAMWARTAAEVGSARAAAPLYELIEPWRDRFVWNGASGYGSAESYLGMLAATLGSHDRAHEHFAAASARHERQRARVWEAQNLCYWARSRVQAGSAGEGRSMAERALELARVNGYGLSARRAARLVDVAATA